MKLGPLQIAFHTRRIELQHQEDILSGKTTTLGRAYLDFLEVMVQDSMQLENAAVGDNAADSFDGIFVDGTVAEGTVVDGTVEDETPVDETAVEVWIESSIGLVTVLDLVVVETVLDLVVVEMDESLGSELESPRLG